jgi:4-hydroxy-3-polyprenylbenzoate decarboxylase
VAAPADLRDWIALLERERELVRVQAEVDPRLEVTEIVDRTVRAGGPALLFERVTGSEHALLVNQFGTERRMCLALGVPSLDEAGAKLANVLEMQPPSGLADKLRGLRQLKSIADSLPNVVRKGACQELVLTGEEIDLGRLPVQTCWPLDGGPFITLPAVITRDPRTGGRNAFVRLVPSLARQRSMSFSQPRSRRHAARRSARRASRRYSYSRAILFWKVSSPAFRARRAP